ncbi:recombinase XerC [Paenibacillus dendritiformis]|uniref:tyrosine-type recombinase/integrase n=1 Tax=Paenibacillus TaxID=44249 RepID=UPI001B0879F2|nr:tyrosine-type recombinase/integrase [Paenibacillus dendritiformis]GIO79623.1 recombinase XerC [Paenibacillus dendritiformis]
MINELISKYESLLRGNGSSENTIVRYTQVANQFIIWHQELLNKDYFDPKEVSVLDLQQWKQYLINEATFQRGKGKPKKYSISSVNNSIVAIKSFFGSLYKMGMVENDPSSKLKKQKVNADFESEPRWLERHERNKLIRAIEDEKSESKNRWKFTRNRAIVYVQLLAGLRVSEVTDLEMDDVSFEMGYIFIRDGKGGKARRVEMNKELRRALGDWMNERGEANTRKVFTSSRGGNPLTKRGVEYLYESLSKKTGISDLTTHVPRHTLAHDLIESGYSIQRVADILGHSNLNYTRVYTKSSTQERREALESLSSI